jgi:hypothetical protein
MECLFRPTLATKTRTSRGWGTRQVCVDGLELMKYSKRTDWNTEESELARAHRLRMEAGLPIADLTTSNPTRCGFDYGDGLLKALGDARALGYDPQPWDCWRRGRLCGIITPRLG